jgi:hypothetical protein
MKHADEENDEGNKNPIRQAPIPGREAGSTNLIVGTLGRFDTDPLGNLEG